MTITGVCRTIVQEWMSLVREKRQFKEQAAAFARNAAQCHSLPCSRRAPHHGN
jgi:hypothetical protein